MSPKIGVGGANIPGCLRQTLGKFSHAGAYEELDHSVSVEHGPLDSADLLTCKTIWSPEVRVSDTVSHSKLTSWLRRSLGVDAEREVHILKTLIQEEKRDTQVCIELVPAVQYFESMDLGFKSKLTPLQLEPLFWDKITRSWYREGFGGFKGVNAQSIRAVYSHK